MADEKKGIQRIEGVMVGEYTANNGKSYPTLSIPVGDADKDGLHYPFTFGVGKAKAIVAHIEVIKQFAAGKLEPF